VAGVTDKALGARTDSLTERKRRRAKEAIRRAALDLFTERGYDAVSVTDIARRAEVGRTTFFRYFGDKQEVLFADPQDDGGIADPLPRPDGVAEPIGSSMTEALRAIRTLVVGYVTHITTDPDAYNRHEELVNGHPELYARSLVKQRSYAERLTRLLEGWGAKPAVARQGAEIGMACFFVGRAMANDDPRKLVREVSRAFDRLEQ
jgi:AcrR family transcriptional regulator